VATPDVWASVLGVPESCLRRAARKGELKASCRGGRYLVLGSWLLDWIEAGQAEAELRRKRKVPDEVSARLVEARRQRLQSV
jgi:hypothetical protein